MTLTKTMSLCAYVVKKISCHFCYDFKLLDTNQQVIPSLLGCSRPVCAIEAPFLFVRPTHLVVTIDRRKPTGFVLAKLHKDLPYK